MGAGYAFCLWSSRRKKLEREAMGDWDQKWATSASERRVVIFDQLVEPRIQPGKWQLMPRQAKMPVACVRLEPPAAFEPRPNRIGSRFCGIDPQI